jgi:signal transduction histidine kinase/HAMP domain-containing protein
MSKDGEQVAIRQEERGPRSNGEVVDQAALEDLLAALRAAERGDFSTRLRAGRSGIFGEIAHAYNGLMEMNARTVEEIERIGRTVGREGHPTERLSIGGVPGAWAAQARAINDLIDDLMRPTTEISRVIMAVAEGDLSQKMPLEIEGHPVQGEFARVGRAVNAMVDQLSSFAAEVSRVAKEVGTEGKLGGQAQVDEVSGIWKDLTDNVNNMASNLTSQVRNIAHVATAVADGDLSQKITVEAKGEVAALADTINSMTDTLRTFADQVTRVAREVGTEGKLGGQADVPGVAGIWKDLTDNVNQLAANLTTQVRAIAEVSTAVTQGDLTRSITVDAQGEVAELKDNINQMIQNLKATTQKNAEQDWLKTNLARISQMMQGQRDLQTLTRLVMSELPPTVAAQHGAFFLAEAPGADLSLVASYGYKARKGLVTSFGVGEGLVGQAALERELILITDPPPDYVRVTSGLGESPPGNIVVLPVVFEEEVLGVIELGSFRPFSEVDLTFLEQVVETIGVVLNTINASMRTEELLEQSQRLTQELQSQQDELQQTNAELEEKASLLAEQNRNIEIKNREIEMARRGLEEKAEQLAQSSHYKSEFLANVSHELRTPLNSLLILAQLLMENKDGNLTEEQVEFVASISEAGRELLDLIDDILDLSKVESGRIDVAPVPVRLAEFVDFVEQGFRPIASKRKVEFGVRIEPDVPEEIVTDPHRVRQVLKNLLSNAFKFTEEGEVSLTIGRGSDGVSFTVSDTGIGVPEDKLDVIFEAFRQADGTTSRKFGGTGLGLSISREIAHLLGGEIRVRSTVGRGSTFVLWLPLRLEPSAEPLPGGDLVSAVQQIEVPGRVPLRTRVLVTSEDDERLETLADVLVRAGVDTVAIDAAAAHVALLDDRFHAVLVDLDPPGTAGFAVLRGLMDDPRLEGLKVVTYRSRELLRTEDAQMRACRETFDLHEVGSDDDLRAAIEAIVSDAPSSRKAELPPPRPAPLGGGAGGGGRCIEIAVARDVAEHGGELVA